MLKESKNDPHVRSQWPPSNRLCHLCLSPGTPFIHKEYRVSPPIRPWRYDFKPQHRMLGTNQRDALDPKPLCPTISRPVSPPQTQESPPHESCKCREHPRLEPPSISLIVSSLTILEQISLLPELAFVTRRRTEQESSLLYPHPK